MGSDSTVLRSGRHSRTGYVENLVRLQDRDGPRDPGPGACNFRASRRDRDRSGPAAGRMARCRGRQVHGHLAPTQPARQKADGTGQSRTTGSLLSASVVQRVRSPPKTASAGIRAGSRRRDRAMRLAALARPRRRPSFWEQCRRRGRASCGWPGMRSRRGRRQCRVPASPAVAAASAGRLDSGGSVDRGVPQMGAYLAANGHRRPATLSDTELVIPSQAAHQATSGITRPPVAIA
jgi:hypothetical protein